MPHVTFIHGIANKPPADQLIKIWRRSLAADDGIDLPVKGVTSSLVHWADVLYDKPFGEGDAHESVGNETMVSAVDENVDWQQGLQGEEQRFVEGLAGKLNLDAASPADDDFEPEAVEQLGFERIPLPWFIKRRLMKVLLRDVHHYLFNSESTPRPGVTYRVQDEIRDRLVKTLQRDADANAGKGPHVLMSHSMGTVIAYDCLMRVPDCPKIDALMTIGSPLGIDEIQDMLKPEWSRSDGYPSDKVESGWANVYDRLDPVAFDARLANDFQQGGRQVVHDQCQVNIGRWRHGIEKYLVRDELRTILAKQLGINWS